MKKSLIALAVAGAFAAPAFAATENVDVYGKLHMSVSLVDDQFEGNVGPDGIAGTNDDVVGVNDVQISSNASRIGFKGAEDLGGGLSGIWQIESGVNLDEQSGSLGSRNSFLGLKGGFGTVLAGNHDTPLKLVGRSVDLFGDTMADSRNVMTLATDMRADNVVAYISPSFSGLTFAAAYSTDPDVVNTPNTNAADRDESSVVSANATYANGPLFLGAGFSTGDALDNGGIDSEWRLAGGFTFGNFKVVGQYDTMDADVGGYDAWMLGGAFTMGNVVLKANYMAGEVDGTSIEPEQWAIGADYNLSKRTSLYTLYVSAEDAISDLGDGAGSSDRIASGNVDGEISALSVGVVHSF